MFAAYYLLLMYAVLVVVSSQSCNNNQFINGCSVPFGVGWFTEQFRWACNRHDVCYKCGTSRGISRTTCDNAFRRDMENTCRYRRRRRFECMTAADTYYRAVSVAGGLPTYWNRNYDRRCYEPWVRRCMPR